MKYAFLLYPHQNVRYRQSMKLLAEQELRMTLRALGHECDVKLEDMGGAAFLRFEAENLTPEKLLASLEAIGL